MASYVFFPFDYNEFTHGYKCLLSWKQLLHRTSQIQKSERMEEKISWWTLLSSCHSDTFFKSKKQWICTIEWTLPCLGISGFVDLIFSIKITPMCSELQLKRIFSCFHLLLWKLSTAKNNCVVIITIKLDIFYTQSSGTGFKGPILSAHLDWYKSLLSD